MKPIDILNRKYAYPAQEDDHVAQVDQIEPQPPNQTWRDSAPIVALSDHLKQHEHMGFKLAAAEDGRPTLLFEPGLRPSESERWDAAKEACRLLLLAREDLYKLMDDGLMQLPPKGRG